MSDFNTRLIEAVADNPLLYDILHPDYKNLPKTSELWNEIASELGASVNACQTRWRTLRSSYVKKHKKSMQKRSGKVIESWRYADQMSFLEEYITHKDPGTTFAEKIMASSKKRNSSVSKEFAQLSKDDVEDLDDDTSSNSSVADISLNTTNPAKRIKLHENTQKEYDLLLKENRKQLEEIISEKKFDRFDHFGNFIAAHLKTKPSDIAEFYMKEITTLVFSDINIEITMKNNT